MYWSEWNDEGRGTLHQSNLDGSAVEVAFDHKWASIYRFEVDLENQRLYWWNNALNTPWVRANLDGGYAVAISGCSWQGLELDRRRDST